MRAEELDFPLPEELIALHPPTHREGSRLLALHAASGRLQHLVFKELKQLLQPGDLLVFNDTKVVPARILARKPTGGQVEGLWLGTRPDGSAMFMLSGSRLRPGTELFLVNDEDQQADHHRLRLTRRLAPGRWLLEDEGQRDWLQLLANFGKTPLPPYIRKRRTSLAQKDETSEDRDRYQTVWAKNAGAVAAPTASLHFSQQLLRSLTTRDVNFSFLTLHVGAGTFAPIETEEVEAHPIHSEFYSVPIAAQRQLYQTRKRGDRVIAVGTTVTRVLEHLGSDILPPDREPNHWREIRGETQLMITPGFRFRWLNGLITNFHTPRSTLLALVAAFAEHLGMSPGLDRVKEVYAEAIRLRYRFYSYGDATIWLP